MIHGHLWSLAEPREASSFSSIGRGRLGPTDIEVKQTGRAGCWISVDMHTSFHSFLLILVHLKLESKWTQGLEVGPIQSPNCALVFKASESSY